MLLKMAPLIRTTETTPALSLPPCEANWASGNLGVPCVTAPHQVPGNSSIEPLGWESCRQEM